ncbi:hypothetical protein FRB97_003435 [Tulasnella sp. 331]|nr:hypothetical protein FRB97_003435 [Tulasnella sp. 331]
MAASSQLEFLTEEQINQFHRDGFLLLPNFLDQGDVQEMRSRSKQLLDEFDISNHPMTKFVTGDSNQSEKAHVGDNYFLNSGDKIRYFLEEDAVGSDGKLNRPKELAVNKIGHALHELDPIFRRVTLKNERLRSLARDLKFHKDPVVPEHNDRYGSPIGPQYTDPVSALGFWFALEDCTPSNGALSFAPGSHLTHTVDRRFVRTANGGTGFEKLCEPAAPLRDEDYIMKPCPAGTLVLIHGGVLHKSERNTSEKTRYAYTFHMIESEPPAIYDEKNWLQLIRIAIDVDKQCEKDGLNSDWYLKATLAT